MHYPVMEFTVIPVTGVYQGVTDWFLDLHKWGSVSVFSGTANNLQQPPIVGFAKLQKMLVHNKHTKYVLNT